MRRPRSTSTSRRSLAGGVPAAAAGQLIAGTGAVLALLSPVGIVLAASGVGLMLLGVVLAAPYARISGPYLDEWWMALAASTLACLCGFAAELFLPFVGGVLLTVGGVTALIVLGLSTPPQPSDG